MGDVFGIGMAAAGVQAEYGRFMGVAAHSDHRMGGQIILRIRQRRAAKSTLLSVQGLLMGIKYPPDEMSQAQHKGQLVLLKQYG